MKRLPIDPSLKTVTTKVSNKAWERAQMLKVKNDCRLSDVISVCLLYMPEDEIEKILKTHSEVYNSLPKSVKGMLGKLDTLGDEERAMLRELLA